MTIIQRIIVLISVCKFTVKLRVCLVAQFLSANTNQNLTPVWHAFIACVIKHQCEKYDLILQYLSKAFYHGFFSLLSHPLWFCTQTQLLKCCLHIMSYMAIYMKYGMLLCIKTRISNCSKLPNFKQVKTFREPLLSKSNCTDKSHNRWNQGFMKLLLLCFIF